MMHYRVELDDRALMEIEAEAFRLSGRLGIERATRWNAQLLIAISSLADMPRIHAVAEDTTTAYPGLEVRRLLYGKGRSISRILFHIIEPQEGEDEGIVRVLRVRHAAMRPLSSQGDEENNEEQAG